MLLPVGTAERARRSFVPAPFLSPPAPAVLFSEKALEKALGDADEVQINQAWMQREIGMTPQTWCKHIQDLRSKYEIVRGRRGSLLRRRGKD